MSRPLVNIVMGSDADFTAMKEAAKVLKYFGIAYDITVSSAHRSPERTFEIAKTARDRGFEVIIAGAGFAAHLAGIIASETILPVIGVPIDNPPLNGLDALLSTVQMPGGVPVAAMSIGKSGAKNAGILAAQILALKYPEISEKLMKFKNEMKSQVNSKAEKIKKNHGKSSQSKST